MLIFVYSEASPVDVEILFLELALVLSFKPFDILNLLFLETQFEAIKILDFALVIAD